MIDKKYCFFASNLSILILYRKFGHPPKSRSSAKKHFRLRGNATEVSLIHQKI